MIPQTPYFRWGSWIPFAQRANTVGMVVKFEGRKGIITRRMTYVLRDIVHPLGQRSWRELPELPAWEERIAP